VLGVAAQLWAEYGGVMAAEELPDFDWSARLGAKGGSELGSVPPMMERELGEESNEMELQGAEMVHHLLAEEQEV
jgi:hypothetical protein